MRSRNNTRQRIAFIRNRKSHTAIEVKVVLLFIGCAFDSWLRVEEHIHACVDLIRFVLLNPMRRISDFSQLEIGTVTSTCIGQRFTQRSVLTAPDQQHGSTYLRRQIVSRISKQSTIVVHCCSRCSCRRRRIKEMRVMCVTYLSVKTCT